MTLIDFPDNVAAILFYSGCNLKCPYCYNPDVVNNVLPSMQSKANTLIKSRIGKLDGFVMSGGECTIHGQTLISDIEYIRSYGYKIKVDSNGSNPKIINELLDKNIVDYFAIDFKCPKHKSFMFANDKKYYDKWLDSVKMLQNSNVPFELRTTIHNKITTLDDIETCLDVLKNEIGYTNTYYLQNFFIHSPKTLGNVSTTEHIDTKLDIDIIKDMANTKNIKIDFRNF